MKEFVIYALSSFVISLTIFLCAIFVSRIMTNNLLDFPLVIKSRVNAAVGVSIILIGFAFIFQGSVVFEIASSFENRELLEKFPALEDIQYHDPADEVSWINDFNIHQLDSDPNILGRELGIQANVSIDEIPKEIAFHIFHADSDVYFTGIEEYHYDALTERLDTVPSLKYGDIYNVKFDPTQTTGEKAPYTLNGFSNIAFDKPGTYYAQVSVKLQNGEIVHFHSTTSAFVISDGEHEWMINALEILSVEEAINRYLSINSFGWVFVAIGIGLVVTGIPVFVSSVEKHLSVVERLKKGQ